MTDYALTTAIWWIRRDLRLSDNDALTAALKQADRVVPTFIIDPVLVNGRAAADKRLTFLWARLHSLDKQLRQLGSYLVIRQGSPAAELAALATETNAQAIYAEADYSPYARRRDEDIAARLPLKLVGGVTVQPPTAVYKADGAPYTVYTPFSKQWRDKTLPLTSADLKAKPARIETPANLHTQPLPQPPLLPESLLFPADEDEAQRRLQAFAAGEDAPIFAYASRRNQMDLEGTSQLSPYLRFGLLSARQAVIAALSAWNRAADADGRQGANVWLNELIWREFYVSILYHFPHVLTGSFNPVYNNIPWRNDPEHFLAWQNGLTGFPIIDAAMRQLTATGWMHNRARMIVASFLVKDLLIDWRWGEGHFMRHLVDGDPAANNGGWQWTAGTGTDAAPYFRIFNPVTQSEKFDPEGRYIRRWVPELTAVSNGYIHFPAAMPSLEQQQVGVIIGRHYPRPIIDRQQMRAQTLAAYKLARESV